MPAPLPREIDAFISSLYGAASTGCRPTAHDLSLYIQMTGWPRRLHIASKGMSMIMVQGPIITVPAPRAKSDRRNSNMSHSSRQDRRTKNGNMPICMCLCFLYNSAYVLEASQINNLFFQSHLTVSTELSNYAEIMCQADAIQLWTTICTQPQLSPTAMVLSGSRGEIIEGMKNTMNNQSDQKCPHCLWEMDHLQLMLEAHVDGLVSVCPTEGSLRKQHGMPQHMPAATQ